MFFSFFPLAYLAKSEPGLAGFKTDSLGRMADSEASNEGFYVHKFIKRYQFLLIVPSKSLLVSIKYGTGSYNHCGSFKVTIFIQLMFTCFAATSGDTPFEEAPVTEKLAWSIRSEVGKDWRSLGVALGLESAFLDNIDTERAWKVLQKWMQKKGKEATMGILINALEEIERKDVVDKLHGT